MKGARKHPKSYADLPYTCYDTYKLTDNENKNVLARFRLVPTGGDVQEPNLKEKKEIWFVQLKFHLVFSPLTVWLKCE